MCFVRKDGDKMQKIKFHKNDNTEKNVSLIISQRMNIVCLTED